jgi:hypothetical protein
LVGGVPAYDLPLIAVLVFGGVPLVLGLARRLLNSSSVPISLPAFRSSSLRSSASTWRARRADAIGR